MWRMSLDTLQIKSRFGDYEVRFSSPFAEVFSKKNFYLIDKRVAELYHEPLEEVLAEKGCLLVKAGEEGKSLTNFGGYCRFFLDMGMKRKDNLVVIGGGTVGDIGGFLASVLFRGVSWSFYPTTLIAQSDSCVGGKTGN